MKKEKLIFLIALVLFTFCKLQSSNLNIMPLTMDFNGVVISGTNIIAYSDNGAILITTDKGISWNQQSIYDYGSIVLMIDKEDALWGIMDIGIILKSTDNGINWTNHKFELEEGDTCKYFAISVDYIFVRTRDKILRFDKDYNYLNEYVNPQLHCSKFEYWNYGIWTEPFLFMTYINKQLIVSVSHKTYNGNGDLFIFNETLTQIVTIDLNQYITGFSLIRYNNFLGFELKNAFEYKDDYVYIIKYLPFFAKNDFTEWNYFYTNTDIGKNEMFIPNYVNNDILYHGYRSTNKLFSYIRRYGSVMGNTPIKTVGISKYNNQSDTIEMIGNYFDNSYYTSKSYDILKIDAITYSLSPPRYSLDFVVIEDSMAVKYTNSVNSASIQRHGRELGTHLSFL